MKKTSIILSIIFSFTACELFPGLSLTRDFGGGDGTSSNPYQINTAKHLSNIANYPDAYFVLTADIDMTDILWTPCSINGGLDGNYHSILNLTINPNITTENVGLISELKSNSYIKNLLLKGVHINCPTLNNVGALVGSVDGDDVIIENCQVHLYKEKAIYGKDCVGGLIGYVWDDITLTNCSVNATTSGHAIAGQSYVGGAIGYLNVNEVKDIHVNANLAAVGFCGGIAGYAESNTVQQLSYAGTITAYAGTSQDYGFGGLFGESSYITIINSKADVQINIDNNKAYVAGLVGYPRSTKIRACYSIGDIKGTITKEAYDDEHMTSFIGKSGNEITDCYTLMNYPLQGTSSYYTNNYGIYDLVKDWDNPINIAEIMRASNAEYQQYWNFNNTWTWQGKANNETVMAICPKMIWEQ